MVRIRIYDDDVEKLNIFLFIYLFIEIVALSRVRSRRGLSLKYPIGVQQIKADPIVLQFYSTLKQQQSLSSIKNPLNHSVN